MTHIVTRGQRHRMLRIDRSPAQDGTMKSIKEEIERLFRPVNVVRNQSKSIVRQASGFRSRRASPTSTRSASDARLCARLLVAFCILPFAGCSEPKSVNTGRMDDVVVAAPTATTELPFTIDEAMTLPISEENLIAALRAEGFAITGPRPERGYNVSTVGMTAAAISFKTTGGKLRGVVVAAGRNGDAATAEQNAKLLAAVSALAMDGSRDEARAAVVASTATAFGKGGDDPGRVISYSNSKATVRVRPVPDGGLLFTITPNPERLLQVR